MVQMPVLHWNWPGLHLNSARAKCITARLLTRTLDMLVQLLGRLADLPGFPLKLTAVCRLIRVVAAVVLRVTLPPERNALVVLADKLKDADGVSAKVTILRKCM